MTILKIVCAWCGKITGTKDGKGQTGETSTICDECSERENERLKEDERKLG